MSALLIYEMKLSMVDKYNHKDSEIILIAFLNLEMLTTIADRRDLFG